MIHGKLWEKPTRIEKFVLENELRGKQRLGTFGRFQFQKFKPFLCTGRRFISLLEERQRSLPSQTVPLSHLQVEILPGLETACRKEELLFVQVRCLSNGMCGKGLNQCPLSSDYSAQS